VLTWIFDLYETTVNLLLAFNPNGNPLCLSFVIPWRDGILVTFLYNVFTFVQRKQVGLFFFVISVSQFSVSFSQITFNFGLDISSFFVIYFASVQSVYRSLIVICWI
jgi:hypothetical protein